MRKEGGYKRNSQTAILSSELISQLIIESGKLKKYILLRACLNFIYKKILMLLLAL